MPNAITARVDSSDLNKALLEAQRFSKRTPTLAVNTAAFFVARKWCRDMPKVPMTRIDEELVVQWKNGETAKGNPSIAKKNRKLFGGVGTSKHFTDKPLALLIVLARANLLRKGKQSNYNAITNNRFQLSPSDLVGKAAIDAVMSRMIKSRHSAIAYLASSIKPIIRTLENVVSPKYRRGAAELPSGLRVAGEAKGHAMISTPGEFQASAMISSDIGTTGHPSQQLEKMNEALWRYGAPVLHSAVDDEAMKQAEFVAKQEFIELQKSLRKIGAIR